MRSKLLLGTAVLLAGIGVASAQNAPTNDQGSRSGASAQQNPHDKTDGKAQSGQSGQDRAQMQGRSEPSKSEPNKQDKSSQAQRSEPSDRKGSPEQKRGEMKSEQQGTVGQSQSQNPSERKSGKASDQKASKASDKQSDKTKAEGNQRPQDRTTGQAAQGKGEQGKGVQDRAGQAGTQSQMKRDQNSKGQTGAATSTEGRAGQQSQSGTTSGGSGSVNLTNEQRTRIEQTVLSRKDVPRANRVDFALTVGTTVPSRVRVVEVPSTLIEIHPEWRGHSYFVANDEIVIVDRSHKVIATVPTGSGRASARGSSSSVAANLPPDEIREVQQVLIQRGVYHGEADGRFSPEFREALITFQRQEGIEAVGEIDVRTVTALGLSDKVHVSGSSTTSSSSTTTTTSQSGSANQSGNAMKSGNNRSGQAGKQPEQSTTGQTTKQPDQSKNGQASKQPERSRNGQAAKQTQPSTNGQAGKQPASTSGQAGDKSAAPKSNQARDNMPAKDSTSGQGASQHGSDAQKSDMKKRNDMGAPSDNAGRSR